MKTKAIVIFAVCLLFLQTGFTQDITTKIDEILSEQFKSNETGVAALVAKNGKVIYRKAFGKANLELDVDMTPKSVFEIGSITKQFTAVSILMLVEQGKIKLDDEITKYIPDYPTHEKKITIHHLLTHTSGIKSYTSMQSFGDVFTKDSSPKDFVDFFKDEPMDFDPGEKYLYNNSGFFLLGYIIEIVSEISYQEFIKENIFDKIGMTSSYYGSHSQIIKNRASGYQKEEDFSNAQYISLTLPYAAGSIMSNVDDMLKWQIAINNHVFVKKETIQKAFTNYTLNNGESINYGYGWSLNELNGEPTIEHGGGIPGYLSMGVYIPSEDVYVILFSNCGCKSPTDIALEITAITIGKTVSNNKKVTLTSQELTQWVGSYKFENATRHITLKDNQLYSQREGSDKAFKIIPSAVNKFYFEEGFIRYEFFVKNGVKEAVFKNRIQKDTGVYFKAEPIKEKKDVIVDASVLKKYIGTYELQPGFDLVIEVKENKIFAQATGQAQFELFAETKSKFYLKVVKASVQFHKK